MLEIEALKSALEKKVGHAVAASRVYRMLARAGWCKVKAFLRAAEARTDETLGALIPQLSGYGLIYNRSKRVAGEQIGRVAGRAWE